MGARHRQLRSIEKRLLHELVVKSGRVVSLNQVRRILRDPGYKETEYGELRSTIRKLARDEILERAQARALFEIQRAEDERVFAEIDQVIEQWAVTEARARRILDAVATR